ncbi:N-acetylmuramoyl-L-alanine amidase [Shouchella patagoniensis]|uniref:N-acetylmuramoyl-L-alanine amidase n=1 Tax=Shouchella patagoniensis TaxID=228576 RepID=UPI000994E093|nr:N-acetylmuramoyl-L-alanine amidase [Shouchella patagoniensis]
MKKVMIDAGHGGSDPGAVGHGMQEKSLVLMIAKGIEAELSAYQVEVKLTRATDRIVSLTDRARQANTWGADLFVSIHINAGGGTGFESFTHPSAGRTTKTMQQTIHQAIIKQLNVRDRGQKTANFAVLRETEMPAVLTESLFIDHVQDAKLLKKRSTIEAIVAGHREGIVNALALSKKHKLSVHDQLYRVIVDNKQVGAYTEAKNAAKQVEAHFGRAKSIRLERV